MAQVPDQAIVYFSKRGHQEANTELEARFGIGLDDLVARLTDPEHGLTAHASHLEAITAVALPSAGAEVAGQVHTPSWLGRTR